jgi:hypothetical protein
MVRSDRYPRWVCVAVATACFFVLLPLATLLMRALLVALVERGMLNVGVPDILVAWIATAVTVLMAYLPARWLYFGLRWRVVGDEAPPQCRVCGCDLSEDIMARRCPACGTVIQ